MKQVPPPERHAGIVIAALRGGSGKTIFSVGIIAALRKRGITIAPFKKGPDYIDAGWLSLAAGRPCYNLDSFLIDPETLVQSYLTHAGDMAAAVIEGNRGLYDCIDTDGMTSTAELAKLLDLPVVLCLDATKTTRTMAAVVVGCQQFDPGVRIAGVVLNRVAGARHEKISRDSIEQHCGVPVLGAMPKLSKQSFPERHMGLVPTYEHRWAHDAVDAIAELAETYLDMPAFAALAGIGKALRCDVHAGTTALLESSAGLARSASGSGSTEKPPGRDSAAGADADREGLTNAGPDKRPAAPELPAGMGIAPAAAVVGQQKPRIGVIRDSAFQFYYPENLEALVQAGARLVITSPLFEDNLPPLDGLYIGGGFPETHAAQLFRNVTYRSQLKELADQGLPIYAECGGLMYLGRELVLEEGTYPMAGVLPVSFGFSKRPQGHGYTIVRVARANPFYRIGEVIKGHEFHYSTVTACEAAEGDLAFDMQRGAGLLPGRDGLCRKNVLATYTHIHALGTPGWAPAMVSLARRYQAAA